MKPPVWCAIAMFGLATLLSPGATAEVQTVYVYNFDFSVNPQGEPIVDAVIEAGDSIRWQWAGGLHSVRSVADQSEQWASSLTSTIGFTFERTFNNPGVYWYYCTLHGFDNFDGTAGGMAGTITVVPAQAFILGDANCDGRFDNFDIDPFVLKLVEPGVYDAQYPGCNPDNTDINGDGRFDNFDIDPFVDLLISS
ncbi:MAG: hypothetical protein HRU75_12330 [Planctomycetia bacterium]|nr:MAG: hypothetical protein HRU75_12330 [Planctomycetia bacterium]